MLNFFSLPKVGYEQGYTGLARKNLASRSTPRTHAPRFFIGNTQPTCRNSRRCRSVFRTAFFGRFSPLLAVLLWGCDHEPRFVPIPADTTSSIIIDSTGAVVGGSAAR